MKSIVYFLLLSLTFFSCAEESAYGPDIIPPDEFIEGEVVDTFTVLARVERDDTLRADGARYALLGDMWDASLGRTQAGFLSTVSITQPVQSFGVNPKIDSMVMILQFHRGYGDVSKFTGYQELQVFEVLDSILPPPATTGYHQSNQNFSIASQPLATRGFVPQFGTGADFSRLRIRLSNDLGQRLLDADSLKNSNIRAVLKGLYVKANLFQPSPGNGGIAAFDLSATGSSIVLYFNNASAPIQSVSISMAGAQNIRINRFTHDYSVGDPSITQKLADTSYNYLQQSDLYLQTMQGLRIYCRIPHFTKLNQQGKWIVNQAEITLPVKELDIERFTLPALLSTYYYSDANLIRPMDDITSNYFSGTYNSTKKAFILRPTRYFQKVLSGSIPDKGFYIDFPVLTNLKVSEARRAIFAGPKDAQTPMKIKFILTRITD